MAPNDLVDRMRQRLGVLSEISVAVLFGSRATGEVRADSDLDVAILPARGNRSRRRLQTDVAVALADLAPGGRVDVVFVDEAPALLRQRIMETGVAVLMRDEGAWRAWRVRTMREHGDREHVRRLLRRKQKERILGGSIGGGSGRALESLERVGKLSR